MTEPISVECPGCGAKLRIKSRAAVGRRVPCPKCGRPFTIQAPEPEDEFAALDDFDSYEDARGFDDDEDYGAPAKPSRQEPRGRKKKSRKAAARADWQKPALVAAGGLLVLLLIAGGLAVAVRGVAAGDGNRVDMRWLPHDTELLVAVRVRDAWNSPLVRKILSDPGMKAGLAQWKRASGMKASDDVEDIGTVVFGVAGLSDGAAGPLGFDGAFENGDMIAVVRTRKRLDTRDLQKLRAGAHVGKTYYFMPDGNCIHVADSRTMVMGPEKSLRAALERNGSSQRRPEFDFIDAGQHLVVAFVPKNPNLFQQDAPDPAADPAEMSAAARNLDDLRKDLKGFAFGASLTSTVQLQVQVRCSGSDSAGRMKASVDELLAEGRGANRQPNVPFPFMGVAPALEEFVNSIRVQQSGETVVAQATVPESIASNFQQAAMLAGAVMAGGLGDGLFDGGGDEWEPEAPPHGAVPPPFTPPNFVQPGF